MRTQSTHICHVKAHACIQGSHSSHSRAICWDRTLNGSREFMADVHLNRRLTASLRSAGRKLCMHVCVCANGAKRCVARVGCSRCECVGVCASAGADCYVSVYDCCCRCCDSERQSGDTVISTKARGSFFLSSSSFGSSFCVQICAGLCVCVCCHTIFAALTL